MRERHCCDIPNEVERTNPVGTRFPCSHCGMGIILGPGILGGYNSLVHYVHWVFKHRKFDSEKVWSTWMRGTENGEKFVYMRCFGCGGILKAPESDVDPNGYVTPERDGNGYHCLYCPCHFSNYPYLEGWKDEKAK